jgi:hypothetical protein
MNRSIAKFGDRMALPRVSRKRILRQTRRLAHEGNIRHLVVKNRRGKVLVELPMAAGMIGIALAPRWALIGTVTALASECSISVHKS